MSKPTKAQLDYLRNAREVMDAGRGKRNYFDLDGPGHLDTGEACRVCGWVNGPYAYSYHYLTPAGWRVLEEAEKAERPKGDAPC